MVRGGGVGWEGWENRGRVGADERWAGGGETRHPLLMYNLIAILVLTISMFFDCKGIDRATGVHLLPEVLLTFLCRLFFEFA